MTWYEYCLLVRCIGKLEGLREALPENTANWLNGIIVDLGIIAEKTHPGRTREGEEAR